MYVVVWYIQDLYGVWKVSEGPVWSGAESGLPVSPEAVSLLAVVSTPASNTLVHTNYIDSAMMYTIRHTCFNNEVYRRKVNVKQTSQLCTTRTTLFSKKKRSCPGWGSNQRHSSRLAFYQLSYEGLSAGTVHNTKATSNHIAMVRLFVYILFLSTSLQSVTLGYYHSGCWCC